MPKTTRTLRPRQTKKVPLGARYNRIEYDLYIRNISANVNDLETSNRTLKTEIMQLNERNTKLMEKIRKLESECAMRDDLIELQRIQKKGISTHKGNKTFGTCKIRCGQQLSSINYKDIISSDDDSIPDLEQIPVWTDLSEVSDEELSG